MKACVSCACSGVAVRPVPMAQTGSYAITTRFSSSALMPARPFSSCALTTALVVPPSRSSLSSPMHRMALRPASSTFFVLALISASSSPKIERRSECPVSTCEQPTDEIIGMEVAPVNAPLSSVQQSCAPRATLEPASTSATGLRNGKGTHTATSAFAPSDDFLTSAASLTASSRTRFIFQLPAMSGVRSAMTTAVDEAATRDDARRSGAPARKPAACLAASARAARYTPRRVESAIVITC
mmetsp:Transcript_8696/g.22505  ORF Transcript_8696/g.22505 Transcript_8696/m.22505 type:complete len:241 (+) Transcript_8696:548-1270(+)